MFEVYIPPFNLPGWMIEQIRKRKEEERRRQQIGDRPPIYDYDSDPRQYYCRGSEPQPARRIYEISLA
jgi:hypothetical protein